MGDCWYTDICSEKKPSNNTSTLFHWHDKWPQLPRVSEQRFLRQSCPAPHGSFQRTLVQWITSLIKALKIWAPQYWSNGLFRGIANLGKILWWSCGYSEVNLMLILRSFFTKGWELKEKLAKTSQFSRYRVHLTPSDYRINGSSVEQGLRVTTPPFSVKKAKNRFSLINIPHAIHRNARLFGLSLILSLHFFLRGMCVNQEPASINYFP